MNKKILLIILCLPFILMCKKDDDHDDDHNEVEYHSLEVAFNHHFDEIPLTFNNTDFTNAAGNQLGFYNFKYLISDIHLIKEDGEEVTISDHYAFINPLEDRNSFVLDSVPDGHYKGIQFLIGLEETANTSDPAQYPINHPLSPILNGLHWSWQEGYIFLAMEGTYEKEGGIGAFTYHIAFEENQMDIDLETEEFDFHDDGKLTIGFNVAEAFRNPYSFDINEDGNFSHSSNDNGIANNLKDNVLNAFNIESYE